MSATGDPSATTPQVYQQYLEDTFGPAASLVASRYPVALFNSTPFPAFYAYVQVATETSYLCPAYHGLMNAERMGMPVWTYRWAQAPTCPWYEDLTPESLPILGATHTAEIPFVFANVENNPPPDGDCSFTEAEQALSRQFVSFWTSMAANGEPGGQWPTFSTDGTPGVNVLNGSDSAMPGTVDYSVCAFWDQVQQIVIQGASSTGSGNGTSASSPPIASATGGSSNVVVNNVLLAGMLTIMGVATFVV